MSLTVTIEKAGGYWTVASKEASNLKVSSVFVSSTELIFALKSMVVSSIRMKGIGSIVRIGTSSIITWNCAATAAFSGANCAVATAWVPPAGGWGIAIVGAAV